MSLSTRMVAYFLTTLTVVLLGFSVTLFLLARAYLYSQADERLDAALQVLGAAVDVKPDGLEWDAEEHEQHITIGLAPHAEEVRWLILDGQNQRVASSRNVSAPPEFSTGSQTHSDASDHHNLTGKDGTLWRVKLRRLDALPRAETGAANRMGRHPRAQRHSVLLLASGLQLAPIHAILTNLALALGGLSLTIGVLAALLARWLCKRALAPVLRMAAAAQTIGAEELERRLPSSGTHDELEDMEQAFNGLLDRVQESYARQKSFTAEASHQLRTPLTAMLGHLEVALRRVRTAEDYRETLQRTEQQTKHMIRLVEALLFLARAETEAGKPEVEDVDLYGWTEKSLAKWQDHPRAADITSHLTETPVTVRAHVGLLDQLLDNLLDNACKFSRPGSEITVCLRRDGNRVRLDVVDQGCGLQPDELQHVFKPFYRSPQARRLGIHGYGLGLAIVQRIAMSLGGSMQVTSQTDTGTVFSLELPLAFSAGRIHESTTRL